MTRIVWLFLFINVYWWSNSTPNDFLLLETASSKNFPHYIFVTFLVVLLIILYLFRKIYQIGWKNKIADSYAYFIISVIDTETPPQEFIFFCLFSGVILARLINMSLQSSLLFSTLIVFVCPLFVYFVSFSVLITLYRQALFSKSSYKNSFFNFFRKHASEGSLILLGLKPIVLKSKQNLKPLETPKVRRFSSFAIRSYSSDLSTSVLQSARNEQASESRLTTTW